MLRQPINLDDAWKGAGRCNDGSGAITGVFFSERYADILRAKAICSRCIVKTKCFSTAEHRSEEWGVWGGELFIKGHVREVLTRGRPPTKPRPKVEIEEVPLPPDLQMPAIRAAG